MTREVQDVPPARRPVRWGAALSHRWPLGLIGTAMSVYGGLIALMLFYAYSGKAREDALLDEQPSQTAPAQIATVQQPPKATTYTDGRPAERVSYAFITDRGRRIEGHSYAPAGEFSATPPDLQQHSLDRALLVEYLPDSPEKNRLVGTRLCLLPDMVTPVLLLVVLPGLLMTLIWFRGAVRLRHLLADGDVAAAEPLRVERIAWIIPVMLRTQYRFRDRHARWCQGFHWVRARSELGTRLAEMPDRIAVVHHRAHPERSRLVVPEDFGIGHTPHGQPDTARRA